MELWSIHSFSPKGTQRKQSFMSLVFKTTLKWGGGAGGGADKTSLILGKLCSIITLNLNFFNSPSQ